MGERTFNRAERRAVLVGPTRARNPQLKAGAPQHFKVWKHEAAAKRLLEKAPTHAIAQAQGFAETKNSDRIHTIARQYPNLWELSHADRASLLALPGVGDATLRRLQHYLEAKNVALAWGVK